ncbi:MAG: hypothetical protein ACOVP5_08145 [Chitinophagales bacterium]
MNKTNNGRKASKNIKIRLRKEKKLNTIDRLFMYLCKNETDMLLKSKVLESFEQLEERVEAEVLIEKIIILDKISKAEEQYENGDIYTQNEVEKEVGQWFA